MSKKMLCVILALITLILPAILSACKQQSVIEDVSVTYANAEIPSSSLNTEDETQPEAQPETQPEAQPETQPEAQPEAQPETQPEIQPETQPETQPEQQPASPADSPLTKQSFKANDGSTLSYWLYTPENAADGMPLLIYLHGGSGKGDDLDILLQNGFPKLLSEGSLGKIPAYIVIPQVPSGMKGWTDIKYSVRDLVNYCGKAYGTDPNRVSLTGHSMGGTGTWNLSLAFPSLFSCIAPMSGSITTSEANINALSGMPVWAFVGSADKIVKPDSSIQFITALMNVNTNARITVFDGADHVSVPELAYLDDEINIIQWLITQSK